MMNKRKFYDANSDSSCDELEDNCVTVITSDQIFREVESVNMQVHFGNIEAKALVEPRSVCSIKHKNLPRVLNDLIEKIGVLFTTEKCNE